MCVRGQTCRDVSPVSSKLSELKLNVFLSWEHPEPQLTQWHDGDILSPELAGDGDLLPEAPAVLGKCIVGS